MELFVVIDKVQNQVLDTFTAPNDSSARIRVAACLYKLDNPIGLKDRVILNVGNIDMSSGQIKSCTPKLITSLETLFLDVLKERKKYEPK